MNNVLKLLSINSFSVVISSEDHMVLDKWANIWLTLSRKHCSKFEFPIQMWRWNLRSNLFSPYFFYQSVYLYNYKRMNKNVTYTHLEGFQLLSKNINHFKPRIEPNDYDTCSQILTPSLWSNPCIQEVGKRNWSEKSLRHFPFEAFYHIRQRWKKFPSLSHIKSFKIRQ